MKYIKLILTSLIILLISGCANKNATEYSNYLKKDFTNNDVLLVLSLEKNEVMHCNENFSFLMKRDGGSITHSVGGQICKKDDSLGFLGKSFVEEKFDDFKTKNTCGNLVFVKLKAGVYNNRTLQLSTYDGNNKTLDALFFNSYKKTTYDFSKRGIYYLGDFVINKSTKSRNCRLPVIDLEVKNMEKRDMALLFKRYPKAKNEPVYNMTKTLKEKKYHDTSL